ncbi:hypothetical protein [Thalassococcus sp. S3]|uniref:hypothetical protein n=1 Tax=Thalassococcus sp. S3 TaxID=2017482 RepID=UPI00102B5B8C|nr:hypothetical protein [Thalassococcus sp. S3]
MRLSPARDDTAVTPGISPGDTGMGFFAEAYAPLPKLWSVGRNTLAEAQVRLRGRSETQDLLAQRADARAETLTKLNAEYANETDAELADLWLELDSNTLSSQADQHRATEIQDRIDAIEEGRNALGHGLDEVYETRTPAFPDISNVGNFPVVTALDAIKRNCGTADEFVRGVVTFLITGEMNPHRAVPLELSCWDLPSAWTRFDQMKTEFMGIAPLGVGAVMYHTFDPCAFTFHNPRG